MITKLTLKDFQCHAKLSIELGRVTTVVGETDRGKSAILRALGFVALNQGNGIQYVRRGQARCRVSCHVGEHVVTRRKGRRVNEYRLDGEKFVAFKSGVPDEIARLLNVGPQNFQRQHDPPFWFFDSPGQVAKNLNSIADLSLIDSSLANVNAELRRAQARLEVLQEQLSAGRAKSKALKYVPEFLADLRHVQGLYADFDSKASSFASAERSASEAISARLTADRSSKAMLEASKALSAGRKAVRLRDRAAGLRQLIRETNKLVSIASAPIPDLSKLTEARRYADQCAEGRRGLQTFIDNIKTEKDTCRRLRKSFSESAKELLKLKRKQRRCPTCGQRLPSPSS